MPIAFSLPFFGQPTKRNWNLWAHIGSLKGTNWSQLGPKGKPFGASWGFSGPPPGALLAASCLLLAALALAALGALLGLSWGLLGPPWRF